MLLQGHNNICDPKVICVISMIHSLYQVLEIEILSTEVGSKNIGHSLCATASLHHLGITNASCHSYTSTQSEWMRGSCSLVGREAHIEEPSPPFLLPSSVLPALLARCRRSSCHSGSQIIQSFNEAPICPIYFNQTHHKHSQ